MASRTLLPSTSSLSRGPSVWSCANRVRDAVGNDPADAPGGDTMEIYERYASLFLHSNATFLCERAHAEVRTAASLEALASCYLRQGAAKRAYAVLCGCASSANGRYLLAVACYKLDKLAEAETALLPDRAARAAGPKASRDLLLGPGSPVPHGAAGLHLLGVVCQHTHRRDHAVEYYRLALRLGAHVGELRRSASSARPSTPTRPSTTTRPTRSGPAGEAAPGPAQRRRPAARQRRRRRRSGRRGRRDAAPVAAGRRRNLFGGPASSARVDDENAPPRRRPSASSAGAFAAPLDMGTPHQRSACGEDSLVARQEPSFDEENAMADAAAAPPPLTATTKPKALTFASATPPGSAYDDASSADKPRAKVARRSDAAPPPEAPATTGADAPPGRARGQGARRLGAALLRVLRRLGAARDCIGRTRGPDALRHLHAVPARHFETGWVQHHVGKVHFEAADYEAAVRSLRTMRRVEPHRMAGLELLSTALWHLKDDVELCYLARHCVDFDARSPEAWCASGNCLSLQKEHDGAIRCFQRAIAVDPRFAYAYTLCGHEYVANEDFEKAIGMYRHAMRIDERHYNAWYGLGAIYYRQEKYELAEYHFDRALCHNPTSSVLHCYLGMTLHANQKCHDALRHLRRAALMEPKNPQARFQCANVLISLDKYEDALAELRAVSDHAPREASVHFLMGKVCKKLGRLDDAMMHFTFALDLEQGQQPHQVPSTASRPGVPRTRGQARAASALGDASGLDSRRVFGRWGVRGRASRAGRTGHGESPPKLLKAPSSNIART
ncbi:anaphase-promoting complex, cyclosome, subunit 3 [Aureococcus anophagefferens]|nr:anaphase-promoting complex, cyclosome, subunit 3 [Aureococcus anophagefferens]